METIPVNFTIYEDLAPSTDQTSKSYDALRDIQDDGYYFGTAAATSVDHYEDYSVTSQTRPIYDYALPLVFEPLVKHLSNLSAHCYFIPQGPPSEPSIPPSRVLCPDNSSLPDELPQQLQSADHQSCLSWRDVTESLEDVLKLPPHPVDIVDQVATMILMEEQITDNMFGCIKLLIWRKLSKFVQTVPLVTNQLSQGELSCLWENNKDKMMLILFGELFSNRSKFFRV